MSQRVVLVDGDAKPDGRVSLDADDQTLLLGRGVFETLRTYEGQLYGLQEHLERLAASARTVGVGCPDLEILAQEMATAASQISGEAVVRVTLTHGGHRIVRANPLMALPEQYRCATRVWVPPSWLPGEAKHTSRAHSVLAVESAGVDEVLWTDEDGYLLEGTRSNVFGVIDGVLVTPPLDGRLLAGVTRTALLQAAAVVGVPVCEAPLHKGAPFDELYLSSTLKELCPITELDGAAAPGGGPVGAMVSEAMRRA